jgi:hypothetical protein
MYLTHANQKEDDSVRRDRPEANVSIILAERVLAVFEESGTTPKEQNTALDIVRTIVLDRLYQPTEPR